MDSKEKLEIEKLEEEIRNLQLTRKLEIIKTVTLIFSAIAALTKLFMI